MNSITNEFERKDIDISNSDIETGLPEGELEICFWLETWFDADKKFGICINGNDDAWIDMFCRYTPESGELYIEWGIDEAWEPIDWHEYEPTDAERELIVSLLVNTIEVNERCKFQEFCEEEKQVWMEVG